MKDSLIVLHSIWVMIRCSRICRNDTQRATVLPPFHLQSLSADIMTASYLSNSFIGGWSTASFSEVLVPCAGSEVQSASYILRLNFGFLDSAKSESLDDPSIARPGSALSPVLSLSVKDPQIRLVAGIVQHGERIQGIQSTHVMVSSCNRGDLIAPLAVFV